MSGKLCHFLFLTNKSFTTSILFPFHSDDFAVIRRHLIRAYHVNDSEFKPGEPILDWSARKRVAIGTARGLEYLHEHCNPKIIHRDVKAANVLLDEGFEPVVGDFGLAKLVDVQKTSVTTQVRGTMGHIAPEYLSTGKSSERTDVFGYGIMLLELVTGQRAIDFSRLEEEDDVLLLDHVSRFLSLLQLIPRSCCLNRFCVRRAFSVLMQAYTSHEISLRNTLTILLQICRSRSCKGKGISTPSLTAT